VREQASKGRQAGKGIGALILNLRGVTAKRPPAKIPPDQIEEIYQQALREDSKLVGYQARLGKPFTHDAYLAELTGLRDQLKAGLSASAHQSDKEEGPSASELADKIKALKAANSIEATPQRVRQKHSTAEEPITARIRRRTEASLSSDQSGESNDVPEAESVPPPAASQDSSDKPPMTFQERIALERKQKSDGPSPK